MSPKRIDAVSISGNVFMEGDIVRVTFDSKNVKNKEGRIYSVTNDFLFIDSSEHYNSTITRIGMSSIVEIVKIN